MRQIGLSLGFALGLVGAACSDDSGQSCEPGQAGCACINGTCAPGLECGLGNICQYPASGDGDGDGDGTSGDGDGDGEPLSCEVEVDPPCTEIGCACGPVSPCGSALGCVDGVCVAETTCAGDFAVNTLDDLDVLVGCSRIVGDLDVGASEFSDLDFLAGVHAIDGTLTVSGGPQLSNAEGLRNLAHLGGAQFTSVPQLSQLELPSLATLDGQLVHNSAAGDGLARLSLPALRGGDNPSITAIVQHFEVPMLRCAGRIQVNNAVANGTMAGPGPTLVNLENLQETSESLLIEYMADLDLRLGPVHSVGKSLEIGRSSGIVDLDLHRLEQVGETLGIYEQTDLVSVDLSGLTSATRLGVDTNPVLSNLSLPALTSAESVIIQLNDALTSIDAPALSSVPSAASEPTLNGELRVLDNPALTSASLPGLASITNELGFERNPQLTSLDLGSLDTLGSSFRFNANSTLSTCALIELRDHLQAQGFAGEVFIYMNAPDCACADPTCP